jgi:restriction system protein
MNINGANWLFKLSIIGLISKEAIMEILCTILFLVILFNVIKIKRNNKLLKDLYLTHKNTLIIKYKQKVYTDDYGNLITDDFEKELDYFIRNVAFPKFRISYDDKYKYRIFYDQLVRLVNKDLEEIISFELQEHNIISGEDYEKYVGQKIESCGWKVSYTPRTGDQGVDLVASNSENFRIAIQCKFYKNPVGNKAVQEIDSGARHYEANMALLITSSALTKSAIQLATSNNVFYIHHDGIESFFTNQLKNIIN